MQDVWSVMMRFLRAQHLVYIAGLALGVWGVFVPSSEVFATHENDHRFIVEGYITDSNGNGLPNTKVFVRAEVLETGITAFADQAGFYSALLHLHDADAGKAVTVTALGTTEHVAADFDPEDKDTERKAIVNIVHAVPPVQYQNDASDSSVYLIWGLVVLIVGISFGVFTRKLLRRRKAPLA